MYFVCARREREEGGRLWFQAFLAEAVETGDENRSMHVLCRKLRKD